MNLTPADVAARILKRKTQNPADFCSAFAPVNIALCKYWGKRCAVLNLPVNDSLSVSMADRGTTTTVQFDDTLKKDVVHLNGTQVKEESVFYQRTASHIRLFRPFLPGRPLKIETENNIATAAGIASSASGFAALTKALTGLGRFTLSGAELSVLARLGSGSACRSVYSGFVRWHGGIREDGMDSHAVPLDRKWPQLCIGLLTLVNEAKTISSREGMQQTVENCYLYTAWPAQAKRDIEQLEQAIEENDFIKLAEVAEHNAMSMHATMIATKPPVLYWQPQTLIAMQKIWQLRQAGLAVYFTMDAGPNIKLIFEYPSLPELKIHFPDMQIIHPFAG